MKVGNSSSTVFQVLRQHFFRRFFDNDTLALEGDSATTIIRALSFVAVPSLMVAFFLQPDYPSFRAEWARAADRYFFVLDALVTMGLVAVFEWEMLFADKLDFLVLSPLPVRFRTMLAAKAVALGQMLGMFLASAVIFGSLIFSALDISSPIANIYMPIWIIRIGAHLVATLAAGCFASFAVLGLSGLMLCVAPARWFRRISLLVQMVLVWAFTMGICLFPLVGHWMEKIAAKPEWTRWLPPVWFLGLYERLLGNGAPWASLSARAWQALVVAGVIAAVTYPLAWTRKRRMVIENADGGSVTRQRWMKLMFLLAGAHRSEERAVFAFIGQTLARHQRYQVYLSLYAGAGLALVTACGVTFADTADGLRLAISVPGLHAAMPMLIFWLMMGLRIAFAFPLELQAAWMFSISGVDMERCVAAARRWVLACGVAAVALLSIPLAAMGWSLWALLAQTVGGLCLVLVLADVFFTFRRGVPFTRARMPGKTSLPIMMAMYLGVFPTLAVALADLTWGIEQRHIRICIPVLIALAMHLLCLWWRKREGYYDGEDALEGTMTLGLGNL